MITYTWKVKSLEVIPSAGQLTDVVHRVKWTLQGVDQQYLGELDNQITIVLDENSAFVPFENLTEEEVIAWIQNTLGQVGVEAYQRAIEQQIDKQKNPPSINRVPPWV